MSDSAPVSHAAGDDDATLQAMLEHRLEQLEQEKHDLQLMLDMAIEHSDTLLNSLRQENDKLMLRLEQTANSVTHSLALGEMSDKPLEKTSEHRGDRPGEDFQLVAEALPIGLIIARLVDGQIVYGNAAMCELLGVSAEQLGQQPITDFCHDSGGAQQLIAAILTQQPFRGQLRWAPSNGTAFDATVLLQPFVFNNEQAVLTVIQAAEIQ